MRVYERELATSLWKQTALIVKEPFTEQDWQERVVDAREFFEELGGIETHTEAYTIERVSQNRKRKVIYQMQEKSAREQQIREAVTEALTQCTPDILIETLKDNFAVGRFYWQKGAEFLNQTTLKELQHTLDTIDPNMIKLSEWAE